MVIRMASFKFTSNTSHNTVAVNSLTFLDILTDWRDDSASYYGCRALIRLLPCSVGSHAGSSLAGNSYIPTSGQTSRHAWLTRLQNISERTRSSVIHIHATQIIKAMWLTDCRPNQVTPRREWCCKVAAVRNQIRAGHCGIRTLFLCSPARLDWLLIALWSVCSSILEIENGDKTTYAFCNYLLVFQGTMSRQYVTTVDKTTKEKLYKMPPQSQFSLNFRSVFATCGCSRF